MSNYLTGLSQLNPTITRFDGGSTSYSLPVASTSNQTLVFINGVCQHPGTDYSVSGSTLTMSSTVPAGTNVLQVMQLFETGIVNTVSDNAIGLAQMASGTDGNLISYDASGNPAHVATGSAGQVLTSAGAGAPPTFATSSGGGFEFVSAVTASASASVTFENMTSTGYDYLLVGSNIKNATDSVNTRLLLGVSGPTYRTSSYRSGTGSHYAGGTYVSSADTTAEIILNSTPVGNNTVERYDFSVNIIDPATSSTATSVYGLSSFLNVNDQILIGQTHGFYTSAEAHTAIKFFTSSGNITSGIFKLYKRANA